MARIFQISPWISQISSRIIRILPRFEFDYRWNRRRAAVVGFGLLLTFVLTSKIFPSSTKRTKSSLSESGFKIPSVDWKAIPKRKSQSFINDKWIVVTTSVSPTDMMVAMASLPDWQLLVLGDSSTPSNWQVQSALYLSERDQKNLNYRISKTLFQGRNSRLNIGHLFAIEHGAKVIYTARDSYRLLNKSLDGVFRLDSNVSKPFNDFLMYSSSTDRTVVNPFVHFGQPSVWPRGLPLDAVAWNHPENHYHTKHGLNVLIRQGLTNGDPDSLDSLFRLTRVSRGARINITFDSCAKPVGVPAGQMVPITSHNVLFHRDAFWAMMLPLGIPSRVADIWRGYWAQKLLFDIGGNVAYFPPSTHQDSEENVAVEEFLSENMLYTRAGELIQFLLAWNTSTKSNLFDRATELSVAMASKGFWLESDIEFTVAWLSDLVSLGLTPPSLSLSTEVSTEGNSKEKGRITRPEGFIICGSEVKTKNLPFLDNPKTSNLLSSMTTCPIGLGILLNEMSRENPPEESELELAHKRCTPVVIPTKEIQKECPSGLPAYIPSTIITYIPSNKELSALEYWRASMREIVLIINYNFPNYANSVKFWRAIYGRVFDKIHVLSPKGSPNWEVQNVQNASNGWLSYRALPSVFSQYPKAKGFLLINDDLLFNYWNFGDADKNKIWYKAPVRVIDITRVIPNGGEWETEPQLYNPIFQAMSRIPKEYVDRFNSYIVTQLPAKPGTGNKSIAKSLPQPPRIHGYVKWIADIYYIPQRLTPAVSELVPIFARFNARSELAIPMILFSTEHPRNWDTLHVAYLWGRGRDKPWNTYSTKVDAYHPWKTTNTKQMSLILEAMAKGDPTLKALSCSICHLERAH